MLIVLFFLVIQPSYADCSKEIIKGLHNETLKCFIDNPPQTIPEKLSQIAFYTDFGLNNIAKQLLTQLYTEYPNHSIVKGLYGQMINNETMIQEALKEVPDLKYLFEDSSQSCVYSKTIIRYKNEKYVARVCKINVKGTIIHDSTKH